MRYQEITSESEDDQEIMEVEMNPGAFQRFLASPAAEGIRAGFEAELIFRGAAGATDDSEGNEDYSLDQRAWSIEDIIDFFSQGENSRTNSELRSLRNSLYDDYQDWQREEFANNYWDESKYNEWAKSIIWPEVKDDYLERASRELDLDLDDDRVIERAQEMFYDDADVDWNEQGEWFQRTEEEAFDEWRENTPEESWLDNQGYRYMSDISTDYDIQWPHIHTARSGSRSWDDIGTALQRVTGLPVRVSQNYHGATRAAGQYVVEPDGSLEPDDEDEDYGLEIVSPPLPLPEALEQLRRVIDWANSEGDAYTNSSTGLHMGVSLPVKGGKVDPIKLILFMGDRDILEKFGRSSNHYARSAYERLESKVRAMKNAGPLQIAAIMDIMKDNLIELAMRDVEGVLGDKYVSVHPQNGYIEFRGPGGDYLAKENEIDNILENTMLRLAYAMSIAGDDSLYRQEYAKKLYKVLTGFRGAETEKDERTGRTRTKIDTGSDDPFMRLFSDYSAGQINAQELKARWADTVLAAERDDVEDVPDVPVGAARDYEVYDRNTGEIYTTFQAYTDDEALEQFSRHYRAPYAQRGLPVLRVKAPGRKGKEPTSRRAELAKRVTRSTRDVGEQLWRVNHHSSVRWVIARSQAEAVNKAVQKDRMFDNPETRARVATDAERRQYEQDLERQQQRVQAQIGDAIPVGTYSTPGGPSYTVANDPRNQQTVAEMMANLKNKLEGMG